MRVLAITLNVFLFVARLHEAIGAEPNPSTSPAAATASVPGWLPELGQTRCFEQADDVNPPSDKPQRPLSVLSFRLTADAEKPGEFRFALDVLGFSWWPHSQSGDCRVDGDQLACMMPSAFDRFVVRFDAEGFAITTAAT